VLLFEVVVDVGECMGSGVEGKGLKETARSWPRRVRDAATAVAVAIVAAPAPAPAPTPTAGAATVACVRVYPTLTRGWPDDGGGRRPARRLLTHIATAAIPAAAAPTPTATAAACSTACVITVRREMVGRGVGALVGNDVGRDVGWLVGYGVGDRVRLLGVEMVCVYLTFPEVSTKENASSVVVAAAAAKAE
jgi:hypothetical protein